MNLEEKNKRLEELVKKYPELERIQDFLGKQKK
jgi:hypothetical protein